MTDAGDGGKEENSGGDDSAGAQDTMEEDIPLADLEMVTKVHR
jgi:hypothetical protein